MTQANETLASFIVRRRREILAAREALLAQIEALDSESDLIEKAAKAAGIVEEFEAVDRIPPTLGMRGPDRPRQRILPERTIKEAVVEILREARHGMTALQILPLVNERLNVDYPRTSLSPQLSRLKAEGVLLRDGIVWSLAKAPETNEAPAHAEAPINPSSPEDADQR
ncbi:hypothetical protein [Xanthobacter flavus]|uniref:hypothetical protein n=1 Tax=Xanthobacter flavus TaxID=281 RepID=UPI00372B0C65